MLVKVVAEQLLARLCSSSGGSDDAVMGEEERSWIWWLLFRGAVGDAAACWEVNSSSRDVRRVVVRRTIVTNYLGKVGKLGMRGRNW